MAKRKITLPGGREAMAEEVEFEAEKEGWNTYILHDGTTLKLRTLLAEVLKVEGEYAPDGNPVYFVNASTVLNTNAPENLRRKPQ